MSVVNLELPSEANPSLAQGTTDLKPLPAAPADDDDDDEGVDGADGDGDSGDGGDLGTHDFGPVLAAVEPAP